MIINLKQPEIEQALRAFVVAQGISLHGKDLSIAFTAGRRESGISAEISIDDVEIPGFTNAFCEEAVINKDPVITLTAPSTPTPLAEKVPAIKGEDPAPVEAEEEPVAETKQTASLFG